MAENLSTFVVMITIVVPVYNRASVVERTLDSIAAQSLRPLRLVLVDNASTDDTAAVLHAWCQKHRTPDFDIEILTETAPGAAAARNAGLAAVDTPWTMFFDSDDVMLPGHLQRVADFIAAHPEADVVGWDTMLYVDGQPVKRLVFAHRDMWLMNLTESIFATQRYAARTDLLRRAGGWDGTLSMGDDIELGMRLLALNPNVCRIDGAPLVRVNHSADSITAATNIDAYIAAMDRIRGLMPTAQQRYVDFQIIAKLNSWGKHNPDSRSRIDALIRRAAAHRRLLRIADFYTRHGGRGLMRLIRPFI